MSHPAHAHDPEAYSAAIYGSIIATALVGALWEEEASAGGMTLSLLSTMAVFWLAHVWAAIAGERIQAGPGFRARRMLELAREEWPMVEAGFAPILALALAWVGLIERDDGARIALGLGIVQLFAWGIVIGRRAYDRWPKALIAGALNGVLGVALVALEITVIH